MQLAIDTSTNTTSLALVQDSAMLTELTWQCEQNHSVELLPHLADLLCQAGASIQSISGIIIARGPGSFNALRVGVSTAKGLAFSLGIPIVGISTLEAEAYQHNEIDLPICPIFNAGRGEIATAIYQMKDNEWQRIIDEHITTVEALCSQITAKTLFCGEFVASITEELKKRLKQKAIISSSPATSRRIGSLAELGQKRLQAGDYDSPATLNPLYLRRPPITQRKHR